MSGKSERRLARDAVAACHEEQLGGLITRVGEAIDGFRAGTLDAFEVDQVLDSRAARELWKQCNLGNVEITAQALREAEAIDWWEVGAPRRVGDRVPSRRITSHLDRRPPGRATATILGLE